MWRSLEYFSPCNGHNGSDHHHLHDQVKFKSVAEFSSSLHEYFENKPFGDIGTELDIERDCHIQLPRRWRIRRTVTHLIFVMVVIRLRNVTR